ncbi:MAG: cysteine dioxygenase family protein [Saprospiraceae bacterium]
MQTLQELIHNIEIEIQENKIDNALDLLPSFDQYIGDDWQAYYESDKDEFQYSVLHKDDNFKLILIYWNGNSKSKKHGHMKGGGLMRILSGEILETRFDSENDEKIIGTFKYSEGDLSYIHDALAFHVVENQEKTPAVSLHIYCNGVNSTFGIFEDIH